MSANGSYLISQEGYTSSTLYMVNDAKPVDLANSAGGATEMQIETKEGASLEAYTGDVTVENVGTVLSELFIDGTDLMLATNDDEKYAVMDVTTPSIPNRNIPATRDMTTVLFSCRMQIRRRQEL